MQKLRKSWCILYDGESKEKNKIVKLIVLKSDFLLELHAANY